HHYNQASLVAQSVIAPLVALLLQHPVASAPAAPPPRVVRVWLGSASPLVRGAAVRVYVEAGQDGNLVVLHRRTDGRIEVLFPKHPDTDPFVRAGTYEIRGSDDRAAWVVAEPDGTGMVLAALSPDPLKFDEFVRAAVRGSAGASATRACAAPAADGRSRPRAQSPADPRTTPVLAWVRVRLAPPRRRPHADRAARA